MNVLVAIHHRVDAWTISPAHVDELRTRFPHVTFLHSITRDSDIELAASADVAFALALSKEAVARARELRWLHCSGHAVGHFPLEELAARGVIVTNSRGIQAVPIAEHVMACLLALARKLPISSSASSKIGVENGRTSASYSSASRSKSSTRSALRFGSVSMTGPEPSAKCRPKPGCGSLSGRSPTGSPSASAAPRCDDP